MKILIAYYSRTGNTEKIAEGLKKELEVQGHLVDIEKVKPKKEHSFWIWSLIRIFKGECEIEEPKIKDVSEYDAICIGSPNWTRLSLPMARYLREVTGLKYKKIGFFATTAAPPSFEWYILSAYLLDLTFSKIIDKKGGRIVDSILLSSRFKKWNFQSEYGKKAIKNFCDKVTTPISSYKDYTLKQKEIGNIRFFAVVFSALFAFSLGLHIVLNAFNKGFLSWREYSYFAAISLLTFLFFTVIREKKVGISFGKYIGSFSTILLWTLTMFYAELSLGLGRLMIFGYILIFIIISFFRDQKVVIFSGLLSLLGYGSLFYLHPVIEVFEPALDLTLLLAGCGIVVLITNSLQKYYYRLLEAYDKAEESRAVLEIKVAARTKELKELAESLDKKVKERTKELQERLIELERFQRLTVGRELKMVELKKEIKRLKKELAKYKRKG